MAAEKYRLPEKKRFNFKLMQRLLPTQFSLDKTTDEDLPHIFPGKTQNGAMLLDSPISNIKILK